MTPDAPMAHNVAKFKKGLQYIGWKKNIMPVASFDAGTTEWQLALLMDRDPNIEWWLRTYTNGQAFIRTTDRPYFPDLIALDTEGVYWLIEGKADDHARDDSVLHKKAAAEAWARAVRDDGEFGVWRYMFATESDIKQASGSWNFSSGQYEAGDVDGMFTPLHRALGLAPGPFDLDLVRQAVEGKVKEESDLDWKQNSYHPQNPTWQDEAAKDIAAMANSGGGWVVFGGCRG